jgi:hypothetical protein
MPDPDQSYLTEDEYVKAFLEQNKPKRQKEIQFGSQSMDKTASVSRDAYLSPAERKDIYDLQYLPKYSDEQTAFYKDSGENIYVGIRGSNDIIDYVNDAIVSTGFIGDSLLLPASNNPFYQRVSKTEEQINKIKEEYPDFKINISGHSLGARLATEIGKTNDNYRVTAFNKIAGIPISSDFKNYKNIKEYRIAGDVFSYPSIGNVDILPPLVSNLAIMKEPRLLKTLSSYTPFNVGENIYHPHSINQFINRAKSEKLDADHYARAIAVGFGDILGTIALSKIPNPINFYGDKVMSRSNSLIRRSGLQYGSTGYDVFMRENVAKRPFGIFPSVSDMRALKKPIKKINTLFENPLVSSLTQAGIGGSIAGFAYDKLYKS